MYKLHYALRIHNTSEIRKNKTDHMRLSVLFLYYIICIYYIHMS